MSTILYEKSGRIATLTLNRPEARNAVNGELTTELAEQLLVADADPDVRALVITGAGSMFCSGIDFEGTAQSAASSSGASAAAFDVAKLPTSRLHRMDTPSVCALNGGAAGFGMDLALGCDIRIAGESARMASGYVKTGIAPPESGGTWLLPRLVGQAVAAEVLLTGRKLLAADLLRYGLVSQIVPDDELVDRAREIAEEIAANAPLAVRATKRMLRVSERETFEDHSQRLFMQVMHIMRTEDCQEGVKAFLERREPDFKGR